MKLLGIDRATALLIANNAAQHDAGFRDYLDHEVRRRCSEETGPEKGDAICAGELRVGFESMEAFDGALVEDGRHLRCDDPEAIKYLHADPKMLDATDAAERARQRRQCAAMAVLRTPEAKARLGIGRYHPQCYLEAVRSANTSYSIDDDMAVCLQHAARWAVAMKMVELCADRQFGGDPALADRKKLPIGVECPLPLRHLPPLPQECEYEKIVNKRPWTNMPRQTAHCACTDRYNCRPEDLLTGQPVDNGWKQDDDRRFRTVDAACPATALRRWDDVSEKQICKSPD